MSGLDIIFVDLFCLWDGVGTKIARNSCSSKRQSRGPQKFFSKNYFVGFRLLIVALDEDVEILFAYQDKIVGAGDVEIALSIEAGVTVVN